MQAYNRRQWLLSASIVSIAVGPLVGGLTADQPASSVRIAATQLPITSRAIRLKNERETRTVVTAITADPRGELLAAAGDDHAIRILQASTLKVLHSLTAHRDLIRTLSFDAKGDRLVSAGNDGQVIVWDREDSFSIKKKWSKTPALACVCCSPQGNEMAAVGFDNRVYLVGGNSARKPQFKCDCRDLRAVAYRRDMKVLAVAGRSGALHLFEPQSGRLICERPLHHGRIHDIAFHSESNHLICVGEDGKATVFDTDREELIHRIPVTTSKLFAVAVINKTLAAVAGSDNVIRIIDTENGTVVRNLTGHHGSVSTLDSGGGWLFSGSYDATLRRWEVADVSNQRQRIAEGDSAIDR